jgi:hypothetical protein
VWWDRETRIGAQWREVIDDRLRHATCVVVVWTRSSVRNRWVRDEAETGANRGRLVPARLDDVKPPRGFGEFMYADLAGWQGGRHVQLDRLVKSVATLIEGGVDAPQWSSLDVRVETSRSGVREAQRFVSRVREHTTMFRNNPEAAAALHAALDGVGETYDAVQQAIDDFFAPSGSRAALTAERYRPLAAGRLMADIEGNRGHCTRIGQAYIAEGGLRDALPDTISAEALDELDKLFVEISSADGDLFSAMVAVGQGLADEASALVNLLLAGQKRAARERLRTAEKRLTPLVRSVNQGRAELNRLSGELGLVAS